MPFGAFWTEITTSQLGQGDFLPDCRVPIFFGSGMDVEEVPTFDYDLVVVTQSCDLENQKANLVACCPVFPIADFERVNASFQKRGRWEEVRKGRIEGLHLLGSRTDPTDNRSASVVDFREIYSLPFGYLTTRATQLDKRYRLASPFLDHYSQSFARFFMRVGLPASIPPYR